MTVHERRQLARAMFESIPYEHRLGAQIYGGRTWGGSVPYKAAASGQSIPITNLDYYAGDTGPSFGKHLADQG